MILLVSAALTAILRPQSPWSGRLLRLGALAFPLAAVVLGSLFFLNRYEFRYVWAHSKADYEPWFKLAGMWAGQEGSILLWGVMSAAFAAWGLRSAGDLRRWYVLACSLVLATLAGIQAFESPFRLHEMIEGVQIVPPDGQGMNPTLLNGWIVIHPPTIFAGFGMLIVPFALGLAALITARYDRWVDAVRPWIITSVTLMGVGLCMGGFWAYETLGWGGFWMWDPVENTSFVPWVAGAAFIHSIFVQKAAGRWRVLTAVLGALPMPLFIYGTFLTRSGFLGDSSVHSFAKMDSSALWFLIALLGGALLSLISLGIRAGVRARKAAQAGPQAQTWLNKTVFYGAALWLLFGFGAVTAIGMSWPLVMSLRGQKPEMVDEFLYNSVLSVFFLPFLLAISAAPFLTWRGLTMKQLALKLINPLAFAIFAAGVCLLWMKSEAWPAYKALEEPVRILGGGTVPRTPWMLFVFSLAVFAAAANAMRMLELYPKARQSTGGLITHVGLLMALAGLIFSRGFQQKEVLFVHGQRLAAGLGYELTEQGPTKSFADRKNQVKVEFKGREDSFTATPGLYFTPNLNPQEEPRPNATPHVQRFPFHDIYLALFSFDFGASEPLMLRPNASASAEGASASYQGILFHYKKLETEGVMGTDGAKFIGVVDVTGPDGKTQEVRPSMELAGGKVIENTVKVQDGLKLVMTTPMDAASQAATFRFDYTQPGYPVEVYFKPLTTLVWLGVGIMTFGGFYAAWARRRRPSEPSTHEAAHDSQVEAPSRPSHVR
jgi:cytochrome c-type biogenesis protein CcmF